MDNARTASWFVVRRCLPGTDKVHWTSSRCRTYSKSRRWSTSSQSRLGRDNATNRRTSLCYIELTGSRGLDPMSRIWNGTSLTCLSTTTKMNRWTCVNLFSSSQTIMLIECVCSRQGADNTCYQNPPFLKMFKI